MERAKRKPTGSLSAYDHYLRAMPHLHRGTREAINEALPLFYTAMQLDPEFASAHAMGAGCPVWRKISGWLTDRKRPGLCQSGVDVQHPAGGQRNCAVCRSAN